MKRRNPRLASSKEMLAETIRRVRAGVEPLDQDVESLLREMLIDRE